MVQQLALPLRFDTGQGFAQFWPGPNTEVVDHLRRAAQGLGESPLILWGEPGGGKSHLLNACCALASEHRRTAAYVPLAAFAGQGPAVAEGLDSYALVCLDDLEAVAGDRDWETALFDLFNRLRERQATLIGSASRPPPQLPFALPDLASRLAWGLTLRLHALEEDDLLVVLRLKAQGLGLELPPPVGRYLLTHAPRDLPALVGLLEQLDRASLAAQRRLTVPFVKHQLGVSPCMSS